jgi:hypothetical protein
MSASGMVTVKLTPEQRASFEAFRAELQERTPHTRVSLSDAIRYAVSTASVAIKHGTPVAMSVPAPEPDGLVWNHRRPGEPNAS